MSQAKTGFLLAPLAAVATLTPFVIGFLALTSPSDMNSLNTGNVVYAFVAGAVVAYVHTLLFAVPSFLILRRFGRVTRKSCLLSGGLIGLLPISLIMVLSCTKGTAELCGPGNYNLDVILLFGAYGVVTGYYFWLNIRPRDAD